MTAREMPILAMLQEIRYQVMGWFASRRHRGELTFGELFLELLLGGMKFVNLMIIISIYFSSYSFCVREERLSKTTGLVG